MGHRTAAWTADFAADPSFPRSPAAAWSGLHTALCVPVLGREHFHGAIEFFSAQAGGPDRATLEIVTTAAAQIGAFASLLDERAALIAQFDRSR